MKFNKVLILSSLVVGLYISGCYTIVQHPDITQKDENGYSYNNEVAFYDDCGSCHSDNDPRKYAAMSSSDIEAAHTRPYNTYEDDYYYEPGSYYDYGSYGSNIGYYYNYPWWFEVVPPRTSSDESDDGNSDNNSSRIRNNDGERTESGRSRGSREVIYDRPTVSAPSGSSGSSGSSSAAKENSGSDRSSGTRSRSEDNSNDRKEKQSSSEQSKTRSNDGGRSGGSGRR